MTSSIDEYLFNGEAKVTCRFLGTHIDGTLVVLYPPWAGLAGADRCAHWDGTRGRCLIQSTCQNSIPPNHGTYTISTCRPLSPPLNDVTLSLKITNGDDDNSGTWTCATYKDGQNNITSTVNLFGFGRQPKQYIILLEIHVHSMYVMYNVTM